MGAVGALRVGDLPHLSNIAQEYVKVAALTGIGSAARVKTWVGSVNVRIEDPQAILGNTWDLQFSYDNDGSKHYVYGRGGSVVCLLLNSSSTWVEIASGSELVVDELAEKFEGLNVEQVDDGTVLFRFWGLSPHGPNSYSRFLEVPTWSTIEGNYSRSVRDNVNKLLNAKNFNVGGKLILLHGPPGTGKTHIIRALASEWRKFCMTDYILDCEKFLNDASYMTRVILDNGANPYCDEDEEAEAEPSRLIIIEDAEELVDKNAKARTGQALSRLLNLCDGLIGQGLRLNILITTNVDLGGIHEAIRRVGRCKANIKVGKLSEDEANDWRAARGLSRIKSGDQTLAELYGGLLTPQIGSDPNESKMPGAYL